MAKVLISRSELAELTKAPESRFVSSPSASHRVRTNDTSCGPTYSAPV